MFPLKYRVQATDNSAKAAPDPDRLDGLARRYCAAVGITDAGVVEKQKMNFFKMYRDSHQEGGVCGGMVCDWAHNVLLTSDPAKAISPVRARILQGQAEMTTFKRTAMEKEDPVGTSRDKMYASQGMSLWSLLDNEAFSMRTYEFKDSTAKLLNWIELFEDAPAALSIEMKGGRHALGLLHHQQCHYVLEPNQGLYRFDSVEVATREINNYFIQNVKPGSQFKLWIVNKA